MLWGRLERRPGQPRASSTPRQTCLHRPGSSTLGDFSQEHRAAQEQQQLCCDDASTGSLIETGAMLMVHVPEHQNAPSRSGAPSGLRHNKHACPLHGISRQSDLVPGPRCRVQQPVTAQQQGPVSPVGAEGPSQPTQSEDEILIFAGAGRGLGPSGALVCSADHQPAVGWPHTPWLCQHKAVQTLLGPGTLPWPARAVFAWGYHSCSVTVLVRLLGNLHPG